VHKIGKKLILIWLYSVPFYLTPAGKYIRIEWSDILMRIRPGRPPYKVVNSFPKGLYSASHFIRLLRSI